MTCFGKGLIDELARVDHCHFKDGWASHDLHKRAGIEIGTLTREVDRFRQLLSEAEKREREARVKALEDAALRVEAKAESYQAEARDVRGSDRDRRFYASVANRLRGAASDIRALQSEER